MADTIHAEENFVTDFAARLEAMDAETGAVAGAEAGSAGAGKDAGKDAGSAAPAAAAAKPNADVKAGTPGSDTSTTDAITSADDSETPGSDDAPAGDDSKETGEGAAPAAADDTPEGEEPAKEEGDDKTDDEDGPAADAEAEKQFLATMKKHGLNLKLEDVPAEARPIIEGKLSAMQAAFTRTQMEATAFRAERAEYQAERRFMEEHPEMAIAEVLAKDPDLIEKVQAQLDRHADPDKAKLFGIEIADARKAALNAVSEELTRDERANARADEIVSYARRAASKFRIPYENLENAITLKLAELPEDKRNLTDEQIDAIIARQARIDKAHTSAVVREDRKKTIQDRTADRRTTTPAARIGSGARAATPTGAKKPTNDSEFISHMQQKAGRA